MKKLAWFLLSLLVLVLDQWSKHWVLANLQPYEAKPLMPMLNLNLAYNRGVSFGWLSGAGQAGWSRWVFIAVTLMICVFLITWMLRLPNKARLQGLSLSLILGGALGNLYDRLTLGQVLDFIDVYYRSYHWYVFNLADAAICLGAFLLIFWKWEK